MDTQNTSIWDATSENAPTFPVLIAHHETEVVIIGGGISGLTAALQLSDAGKKVILLEAYQVGSGATGHSTGNLYSTIDETLYALEKKWGIDVTRQVVESRKSAVDFIERNCSELRFEADFERVPFYYFMEEHSKKAERFLDREFQSSLHAGLKAEWVESTPLPFPVLRALKISHQAQFHPLKYARGLASFLSQRCQIFERSPVIEVDAKNGIVRTEKGEIKADVIISATHTPKGVHAVHTRLSPIREHGVAARLKGEGFPGIFWRADGKKYSLRTLKAEGHEYVIAIGDHYKTGQNPHNQENVDDLKAYLEKRVPIGHEKYQWAAQSYRTSDQLPFIGKQGEKLYFLTGFSADGLVYGTLGAMIIADQILNRPNPWCDLYRIQRFTPLKSAVRMTKEGLDNFCQYSKNLPKVGSRSLEEIGFDQGAIVEQNGEKIAVYRDPQGNKFAVSAVCTHLKCIVAFNPAEKTWDCPCHASRFKVTGEVIEGPALKNLEHKIL